MVDSNWLLITYCLLSVTKFVMLTIKLYSRDVLLENLGVVKVNLLPPCKTLRASYRYRAIL